MNDATLIARLFAHDRHAAAAFYQQFAPQLRRHILAKVKTHEDAEEILQDTLFSFLEGLRDFRGNCSVRTYLFSICHNKIIDYYRRKKIGHFVFSQIPQLETLVSPLMSPEAELDATLIKDKIRMVFARMMPDYRQVLVLKYLERASVSEIADKLSITFKSAESRLFRARRAFVELFLSI
ncbi:MAG: sigma-70 family RNA polymerase sigma factor [Patescibacteria group bacterium]